MSAWGGEGRERGALHDPIVVYSLFRFSRATPSPPPRPSSLLPRIIPRFGIGPSTLSSPRVRVPPRKPSPPSPFPSFPVSPGASLSFRPPFVYFLSRAVPPSPPRATFLSALGVPTTLSATARAPFVLPPSAPRPCPRAATPHANRECAHGSRPRSRPCVLPVGPPPLLQMSPASHATFTFHPPYTPSRITVSQPHSHSHNLTQPITHLGFTSIGSSHFGRRLGAGSVSTGSSTPQASAPPLRLSVRLGAPHRVISCAPSPQ